MAINMKCAICGRQQQVPEHEVTWGVRCRKCDTFMDEVIVEKALADHARRLPIKEHQNLKKVAFYQKAVILCVMINILVAVGMYLIPEQFRLWAGLIVIPLLGIIGMAFVFLLAMRVYNPTTGFILGLFTLIPLIGLIILLIVNGKATSQLQKQGIKVGIMGADLSQF